MSFVKFTEVGKNFQPSVVITPAGVISFNQGARKKFKMDAWSHCVMYLDPDAHTIAFELVNDENLAGANRLRHIRHEGVDVNARPFLDHFELRIRRPLSFRVHRDLDTDWLVIVLDQAEALESDEDQTDAAPEPERAEPVSQAPTTPVPSVVRAPARSVTVPPAPASSSARIVDLGTAGPARTPARGVKAMLSELLQD